jgi:flagellar basal-body rod modification protein FlgD
MTVAASNHSLTTPSASTGATTSPTTGTTTGSAALNSLSSNFSDFLSLLTTQLQNQDPSSPMDSNQFTSELVQFSSVEQQINTNSSLTQLIQLTQAGEVMQSSAMVGKRIEVQSNDLTLQNGKATVNFTSPASEQALISVTSDSGMKVLDATVTASKGANSWVWNGENASGTSVPDGTYKVAVTGANADGSTSALAFTVVGTATAVQTNGSSTIQLQMGSMSVPFSAVRSVEN